MVKGYKVFLSDWTCQPGGISNNIVALECLNKMES